MKERGILFKSSTQWIRAAAGRLRVSPELYAAELNAGRKLCGGCKQSHPRTIEFFTTDSRRFDGLGSRCRECASSTKKDHYQRTRPQQRARQLRYQRENREKLYAYNAAWQRRRHFALRAEMIAAYGGECACCGEREPIFLDMDHVNNDGNAHRREVGNSDRIMLELKAQGWPTGRIQLLCSNCNQGKARNGGVCPHVKNRS